VTYTLFGQSVHRDKINAGYDLHSYLASAIASYKEPSLVEGLRFHDHPDRCYEAFMRSRKADDRRKAAKHFRTLAKPVGLGYPGGLSKDTLCVFAKVVYGVRITPDEADDLKQLWFDTYPEMVQYFAWVRDRRDARSEGRYDKNEDDEEKGRRTAFCYETLGLRRFRANASYCAVANGMAMQSLSADGAKMAVCWVGRACAGGAPGTPHAILDACSPLAFIHDELLVALPRDALMTERALAVADLMVQAMQRFMPDVRINVEPALMERWRKDADEPVWKDVPGAWDEAMDQCAAEYGMTVANLVAGAFRAPDVGKRLVPICWESPYEHAD
jgi:hypothetical protein